ncbi:MAG: PAS domain S-box protein [Planctomycetes bacterium]|nr:PAS domain S-box protein [Planctomycetota bacterium]
MGHRKDGSEFPVEISLCPQHTSDGPMVISVIRDLSEQKRSAEILNLRERALEAITEGLFILDAARPGQPIIYVNHAFECLTGYRRDEVLTRGWSLLQGPDANPRVAGEIDAAMAESRSYLVEFLVQRKDGTSFWSTLSFAPIRAPEGRVTHYVGVLADVSEQKRLESQLLQAQKMEAIGRLAGGVAHDFNNFLTVILGHGDLLLQMLPDDHPGRISIEEIAKVGERAAALTNQMLAFSRRQVLAPVIVNLNSLIKDIERMLGRLIREDIRLTRTLDPDLFPVKVDPGQIGQVLMNLVVNARDAMPDGGQITIKTSNVELKASASREMPGIQPGNYVLLTVQDTGCGMDESVRSHIFEPFFTTKQGKGTGLGLATVYGIVKQSGGSIVVQSRPGQGAAFNIYLPHAAEGLSSISRPLPQIDLAGKRATVLLVEDEDGVRTMACKALEQSGFIVLQAANGAEALRLSEHYQGTIDLLVTDVVMPTMGGGEVAQRLLDERPSIKVLYISGYLDDLNVRLKVSKSRAAFLPKPFTAQQLVQKVNETLERPARSRRRELGQLASAS